MAEKKKIPCRVCGKFFEPCSTCQTQNNMFRWRNFACSLKCAEKYISDTVAYRESLKHTDNKKSESTESVKDDSENPTNGNTSTKRKYNKRNSMEVQESEIINNKTE